MNEKFTAQNPLTNLPLAKAPSHCAITGTNLEKVYLPTEMRLKTIVLEIQGSRPIPLPISDQPLYVKHLVLQAPLSKNRGTIWFTEDPLTLSVHRDPKAPSLRAGEKYEFVLSTDRDVAINLNNIYIGGDYSGDLLVATILVEID